MGISKDAYVNLMYILGLNVIQWHYEKSAKAKMLFRADFLF